MAGCFGGPWRPDSETQVPGNSLKQFRKPKPQILISCGWIFWRPVAATDSGTQALETKFPARNPTFSFPAPIFLLRPHSGTQAL